MRIAVLAFGSWFKAKENPPKLVLDRLVQPKLNKALSVAGVELFASEIPVIGAELATKLTEVIKDISPQAIIGIGLGSGSATINLETTAINVKDYGVLDNAGQQPRDEAIITTPDAPAAYRSQLNNHEIVAALNAEMIPARVSHHAGTHCCNQLLYLAHHLAAKHKLAAKCGFIHLPFLHRNALDMSPAPPSMALETQTKAVEIALKTIARG